MAASYSIPLHVWVARWHDEPAYNVSILMLFLRYLGSLLHFNCHRYVIEACFGCEDHRFFFFFFKGKRSHIYPKDIVHTWDHKMPAMIHLLSGHHSWQYFGCSSLKNGEQSITKQWCSLPIQWHDAFNMQCALKLQQASMGCLIVSQPLTSNMKACNVTHISRVPSTASFLTWMLIF